MAVLQLTIAWTLYFLFITPCFFLLAATGFAIWEEIRGVLEHNRKALKESKT